MISGIKMRLYRVPFVRIRRTSVSFGDTRSNTPDLADRDTYAPFRTLSSERVS